MAPQQRRSYFYCGDPVDLSQCPVKVDEAHWGPVQHSHSDVHVSAHVGETMLCTGSDNGDITIWDLRLAKQSRMLNMKHYLTKLVYRTTTEEADEDGRVLLFFFLALALVLVILCFLLSFVL